MEVPTGVGPIAPGNAAPFPSWPTSFAPQHATPPVALMMPQVWFAPAAMGTAATREAEKAAPAGPTCTGVRTGATLVEPLPSCPLTLEPQHHTCPAFAVLSRTTHVCA